MGEQSEQEIELMGIMRKGGQEEGRGGGRERKKEKRRRERRVGSKYYSDEPSSLLTHCESPFLQWASLSPTTQVEHHQAEYESHV